LEALVSQLTSFEASNLRDIVYAVLGLASDAAESCSDTWGFRLQHIPRKLIQPDYSKLVVDAWVDFVAHCVQSSESLDIIVRPWASCESLSKVDQRRVPSWIRSRKYLPFGDPSFRHTGRQGADGLVGATPKPEYNVYPGLRPQVEFVRSPTLRLSARGIDLGRIVQQPVPIEQGIITRECLEMIEFAEDLVHSAPLNSTDASIRVCSFMCAGKVPHVASLISSSGVMDNRRAYRQLLRDSGDIDTEEWLKRDLSPDLSSVLSRIRAVTLNRKIAYIYGTLYALSLIPEAAHDGDRVCVLFGMSVPVILRQTKKNYPSRSIKSWKLVGETYIDGAMNGELREYFQQHRELDIVGTKEVNGESFDIV